MKCKHCGQEYDKPDTNICGNCADDLRLDTEAERIYQELEPQTTPDKDTPVELPF